MRKLQSITVLFILAFTTIIFTNCNGDEEINNLNQEEKIVLTEKNFNEFIVNIQNKFRENSDIFDSFLKKKSNGTLSKNDFQKIIDILEIPKNLDVIELEKSNIKSGVYELLEYRRKSIYEKNIYGECLFNNHQEKGAFNKQSRGAMCERCCNKLVEIRDAMLDECDKQVLGLDETCSLSVTIAYWWKSRHC